MCEEQQKLKRDYLLLMNKELTTLLSAIKLAGHTIQDMQTRKLEVQVKSNHDICTLADLKANEILQETILGAFPEDGWLSEETKDDLKRLTKERVWIVDPIDGTREFVGGLNEYAVSVALVIQGHPVVAAVYNPSTEELFYAKAGSGAWKNNVPIKCLLSNNFPLVLASRSEYRRGEWEIFIDQFEIKPIGSIAYKLALVADGSASATFSLGPKNEWDIAAGVLLVSEAGGWVGDRDFQPFVFNQRNSLVSGIIACSQPSLKAIRDAIQAVAS